MHSTLVYSIVLSLQLFSLLICLYHNPLYTCIELDTEGTIPPDDDPPQQMGDRSVEVTEDMRDKAQEERQQGSMAMAEGISNCNSQRLLFTTCAILLGELDKALEHFTAAVLANPNSAPLYAKRARYSVLS